VVPGKEPGKEGSPDIAHVRIAGGAGGKANPDCLFHRLSP